MSSIKKILFYLFFFIIITSCIYYVYSKNDTAILTSISPVWIIPLFFSMSLFFIFASIPHKFILSSFGISLKIIETVGLSVVTAFGNYLSPAKAGTIFRGAYLIKVHSLTIARFSSVLAFYSLLYIVSTGLVGCLLLALRKIRHETVPSILTVISICLILFPLVILKLPKPFSNVSSRFACFIRDVLKGFHSIKKNYNVIFFSIIFIFIQYFLSAVIITTSFRALGSDISFLEAGLIGIFTTISNFFTITPNNIGIQEAVMTALGSILGCNPAQMLSVSILIRSIHLICTLIYSPILGIILLHPHGIHIQDMFKKKNIETG